MEISDHELMLAVRAGEIDHLGELFERHHRRLFAYLLRFTNDAVTSEDLVQTVFHRILQYRHTYRDEGQFSTWIYHLARTSTADCFRKNKITRAAGGTDMLADFSDGTHSPDDIATLADDLSLLRVALNSLPREDREIIHLARIENRPHDETAHILECSPGAVKVRLHRAMKLLRETYEQLCTTASETAPPP